MRQGSRPESPGEPPRRAPSFRTLAWVALFGSLLVAGALRHDDPPQPTAAQAGLRPGARTDPGTAAKGPGPGPLPASAPVRIRIPAIKVDAFLARLELDAEGTLQPPPASAPALAGWYADGTAPGSRGTAVVAGHVDTPHGPAVFHELGALEKGAEIAVDRQDGRTALFRVDAVEVHAKDAFPDEKVYGGSTRPELRLITCGGTWSEKTGYRANTVVYATLSAVR
ncbi:MULTISPECIES: class F sortase [unclassified Streptomyces]|uniref:class F sortase n=1 Tax=unclassified Streptomyces TaxID=2593676 RepID=UPI002E33472A|nr:class F sortase [Streptomyces sp. NBC_01268]